MLRISYYFNLFLILIYKKVSIFPQKIIVIYTKFLKVTKGGVVFVANNLPKRRYYME